jgi:hypothetical protein
MDEGARGGTERGVGALTGKSAGALASDCEDRFWEPLSIWKGSRSS